MKNKPLIAVAIIVTLLVGGIIVAATAQSDDKPNTVKTASEQTGSRQSQSNNDKVPKDANAVYIQDYKFNPSLITIKKGTTVVWTNQDTVKHNVELDKDQPAGGPTESPLFGKGETFSFTFDTVGTFNYHCSPHPYMKGSVVVTE